MNEPLTAAFEKSPCGCIGYVQELPGTNTQDKTLAEAKANLIEAMELVLQANRELAEEEITSSHRQVVGELLGTEQQTTPVPRYREIDENLANNICKDLGILEP